MGCFPSKESSSPRGTHKILDGIPNDLAVEQDYDVFFDFNSVLHDSDASFVGIIHRNLGRPQDIVFTFKNSSVTCGLIEDKEIPIVAKRLPNFGDEWRALWKTPSSSYVRVEVHIQIDDVSLDLINNLLRHKFPTSFLAFKNTPISLPPDVPCKGWKTELSNGNITIFERSKTINPTSDVRFNGDSHRNPPVKHFCNFFPNGCTIGTVYQEMQWLLLMPIAA